MTNKVTQLAEEYVDAVTPLDHSEFTTDQEAPENMDELEAVLDEIIAKINAIIDQAADPNQMTHDFAKEITLLTRQKLAEISPNNPFTSAGAMFLARSGKTIDFEKLQPKIPKPNPNEVQSILESDKSLRNPLFQDFAKQAICQIILDDGSGPMTAEKAIASIDSHFSRAIYAYYKRGDTITSFVPELEGFKGEVHLHTDTNKLIWLTEFEIIGVEEGEIKFHILLGHDSSKQKWFRKS